MGCDLHPHDCRASSASWLDRAARRGRGPTAAADDAFQAAAPFGRIRSTLRHLSAATRVRGARGGGVPGADQQGHASGISGERAASNSGGCLARCVRPRDVFGRRHPAHARRGGAGRKDQLQRAQEISPFPISRNTPSWSRSPRHERQAGAETAEIPRGRDTAGVRERRRR